MNTTKEEWKLFNLKRDPEELENIIEDNPEIENFLKEQLMNWINR